MSTPDLFAALRRVAEHADPPLAFDIRTANECSQKCWSLRATLASEYSMIVSEKPRAVGGSWLRWSHPKQKE